MVRLKRIAALAGCLAVVLLILLPAGASANVTGGCVVTGTGSISGTTPLTTADTWHLHQDDIVTGAATYPVQTFVHIYAYFLGFPIPLPVYRSTGKDTHGTAGPFHVSDYSKYSRTFAVGGASDSCSGSVWIIVDDFSPFTNFAGIAAIAMFGLGLIGVIGFLVGHGAIGCASRILGAIAGLLLGVGATALLDEMGALDPRSFLGLGLAVVGVGIGIGVPFLRRPAV